MKNLIPKIYGTVTDEGKFNPDDTDKFKNVFFFLRNKRVQVDVKEIQNTRSERQNKYYWSVPVKMISEHTGYSPDQVHNILKQMFNSEPIMIAGIEYRVEKSTKGLSTYEFGEEYIGQIQQWAAETLGLNIPDPNEIV